MPDKDDVWVWWLDDRIIGVFSDPDHNRNGVLSDAICAQFDASEWRYYGLHNGDEWQSPDCKHVLRCEVRRLGALTLDFHHHRQLASQGGERGQALGTGVQ